MYVVALLYRCTHYKDPQYKHTRSGRLGEDGELFKVSFQLFFLNHILTHLLHLLIIYNKQKLL